MRCAEHSVKDEMLLRAQAEIRLPFSLYLPTTLGVLIPLSRVLNLILSRESYGNRVIVFYLGQFRRNLHHRDTEALQGLYHCCTIIGVQYFMATLRMWWDWHPRRLQGLAGRPVKNGFASGIRVTP